MSLSYLRRARGLLRSLVMYYWPPWSIRRIDRFYAELLRPGDLCFDIGAHVGNRSLCFLRLGARVVAVEPQPDLFRFLAWLNRGKQGITLLAVAIGARSGELELHLSEATPTVTSGSRAFIDETPAIASFSEVVWNRALRVPQVTLDSLIAAYGMPDFLKLDIEGMELEALAGLSQPPPLLSFEFLAGRIDDTKACLRRLDELGAWRFNLSIGESLAMRWPRWVEHAELATWLTSQAGKDFSGDIYARLEAAPQAVGTT